MSTTRNTLRALVASISLAAALSCAPDLAAQGAPAAEAAPEPIVLREGDELQITFPGAPSLNTQQRVRSDGRITLDLIGEISPIGLTPLQFQERLIQLYASQLVSREITVRLVSRSFYVYINGSVGTNGRLEFDRPVTLLEAVMAAGFADGTVNLGKVRLMRIEGGKVRSSVIDLNRIMDGKGDENPALRQGDMIIVPGRLL
ncbi:MAG: polysaccharide biosynthesis/export family protein [Opitutaceae bacterium]|nr:polysaccharide biosynthesis/export family protein [Opitutaceae bacterium]